VKDGVYPVSSTQPVVHVMRCLTVPFQLKGVSVGMHLGDELHQPNHRDAGQCLLKRRSLRTCQPDMSVAAAEDMHRQRNPE